jgi:hypothetical protein
VAAWDAQPWPRMPACRLRFGAPGLACSWQRPQRSYLASSSPPRRTHRSALTHNGIGRMAAQIKTAQNVAKAGSYYEKTGLNEPTNPPAYGRPLFRARAVRAKICLTRARAD